MVKEDPMNVLVNDAVAEGLEVLVKKHPRFKDQQHRIADHLDQQRIRESVRGIEEYLQAQERERGKAFSPEERAQFLHQGLVNYVVAGGVLDDDGKEIVLRESLERKAQRGPRAFEARTQLKGERYLENVGVAFRQLYQMFSSGDYAQHMPEVARAVATVRNLGFLGPALDLMRHYALIDDRRYAFIKRNILAKVEKGVEEVNTGMEHVARLEEEKTSAKKKYDPSRDQKQEGRGYFHQTPIREDYSPQGKREERSTVVKAEFGQERSYRHRHLGKVAVAVLGMAGFIVMLFSGTRFTGNVVGASTGETLLPIAGIFLCTAAWLLLGTIRRAHENNV